MPDDVVLDTMMAEVERLESDAEAHQQAYTDATSQSVAEMAEVGAGSDAAAEDVAAAGSSSEPLGGWFGGWFSVTRTAGPTHARRATAQG